MCVCSPEERCCNTLRVVGLGDIMRVEEFKLQNHEENYCLWREAGLPLGLSDPHKEVARFLERNLYTCLVGRDEDSSIIVAVCLGGFDGRRGFVHRMAVAPEHQKKGFGKQILEAVMERFKRQGLVKVHLLVETRNVEVEHFYRQMDWHKRDDIMVVSMT